MQIQHQHKNTDLHESNNKAPRIPLSFQAVFIQGNRGLDIHKPPPDVSKNWWRQLTGGIKKQQHDRNSALKKQSKLPEKCAIASENVSKNKPKPVPTLAPQQYLDGLVKSRGYSNTAYPALSTAYYNKPSPLQLASYGVQVVNIVRNDNAHELRRLMDVGISPNACNAHGESIVHKVCHLSKNDSIMLDVLITAGCETQICDNNGRTPLHHACWAPEPNFAIITRLLESDIQLLYVADQHGHLPLSYTRKEHWTDWLQFLQSKKDTFWPRVKDCKTDATSMLLINMKPNTRIVHPPDNALSTELATMVANGKLTPDEAEILNNPLITDDDDDSDSNYSSDDYDDSSDFDDDTSSSTNDCEEDNTSDDGSNSVIIVKDNKWSLLSPIHDRHVVHDMDDDDASEWSDMDRVLQALSSPIRRPIEW